MSGLLLPGLSGCGVVIPPSVGSQLQVTSLNPEPVVLRGDYRTVVYAHDDARGTRFIISDLPARRLLDGEFDEGQVIHVELLWLPKPGATPMDRTATNASIRHVIFSGGQVGVYGGAGFALPSGKPGDPTFGLKIRQASLSLLESTDGFVDLLSPAEVIGHLTARHDRTRTRQLYFMVSQYVTDALGRSRFVLNDPTPSAVRRYP